MRPYRLVPIACLAALCAASVACSDSTGSNGDDLTIADLVGTWNITQWEYTRKANGETLDLMALPGATATIVIESNGRYTVEAFAPGMGDLEDAGTLDVSSDPMTATPDGEDPEIVVITLSGNTFTLYQDDASNDFGAGEEPASLELVGTRA